MEGTRGPGICQCRTGEAKQAKGCQWVSQGDSWEGVA